MTKTQVTRRILIPTVLIAALGLGGCSGYNNARGRGDVPTHNKTDAAVTVIDDPSCPGGATR